MAIPRNSSPRNIPKTTAYLIFSLVYINTWLKQDRITSHALVHTCHTYFHSKMHHGCPSAKAQITPKRAKLCTLPSIRVYLPLSPSITGTVMLFFPICRGDSSLIISETNTALLSGHLSFLTEDWPAHSLCPLLHQGASAHI